MDYLKRVDTSDEIQRGAVAGLAGGIAMLMAILIDIAVTRHRANDIRLLGELAPFGRRIWPVSGTVIHLFNGALLGALFGWTHHGLPGPVWFRGILFAQIENLALWPLMVLLDHIHPAIRTGRMPRFNQPLSFAQEVLRHAAYGAVLGLVFERLGRR